MPGGNSRHITWLRNADLLATAATNKRPAVKQKACRGRPSRDRAPLAVARRRCEFGSGVFFLCASAGTVLVLALSPRNLRTGRRKEKLSPRTPTHNIRSLAHP